MTRVRINRWTAAAPFFMSGAALALVLGVVATGWERNLPDEGAAAHLFQLLIAAEIPIVALFLGTADRTRFPATLRLLAAQVLAILLAIGSVALFHL